MPSCKSDPTHDPWLNNLGTFDSFIISHQSREIEVQSKQFARTLKRYKMGDFVDFDGASDDGVQAFIEQLYDPDLQNEHCVLLMLYGCFVDYLVCANETEAKHAANTMLMLWYQPERQIAAMVKYARLHYKYHPNLTAKIE